MILQRNARLEELEQRFSSLESRLNDSPEKEALSILHAMIPEGRRQQQAGTEPSKNGDGSTGPTLEDIANLYKSAPPMEGKAEKSGLAVLARRRPTSRCLTPAAGRSRCPIFAVAT